MFESTVKKWDRDWMNKERQCLIIYPYHRNLHFTKYVILFLLKANNRKAMTKPEEPSRRSALKMLVSLFPAPLIGLDEVRAQQTPTIKETHRKYWEVKDAVKTNEFFEIEISEFAKLLKQKPLPMVFDARETDNEAESKIFELGKPVQNNVVRYQWRTIGEDALEDRKGQTGFAITPSTGSPTSVLDSPRETPNGQPEQEGSFLKSFRDRIARVSPKDRNEQSYPIITICHSGVRSADTALLLSQMGFNNIMSIRGGYTNLNEQVAAGNADAVFVAKFLKTAGTQIKR